MKVALLNAHTAYAPGATAVSTSKQIIKEYEWSKLVNKEMQEKLEQVSIQADIIDASTIKPYSESLHYKAFVVNNNSYDIAIETHLNAAQNISAHGFEILYNLKSLRGYRLAQTVANRLIQYSPFEPRYGSGIKGVVGFYLLKNMTCPSIISEFLFITNPNELVYLSYPRAAQSMAAMLATGIVDYLHIG